MAAVFIPVYGALHEQDRTASWIKLSFLGLYRHTLSHSLTGIIVGYIDLSTFSGLFHFLRS